MKTILIFALTAMVLTTGCGGGSSSDGGGVPPAPVLTAPAWERLADRLVQVQAPDGSFAAADGPQSPYGPDALGVQNITGLVGMALFDAWERKPKAEYLSAIALAKGFLVSGMQNYLAGNQEWISVPNFMFLQRYNDRFHGWAPGEWEAVHESIVKAIEDTDAAYGTDPARMGDGILEYIRIRRETAGQAGVAPWDLAFVVRTMRWWIGEVEEDFAAEYLKDLLAGFDATQPGGYAAVAHALDALRASGDASLEADLLAALAGGRLADGSTAGDVQATAYALSAYKAAGDANEGSATEWLEGVVDASGRITDLTGAELPQLEGEVLAALLR